MSATTTNAHMTMREISQMNFGNRPSHRRATCKVDTLGKKFEVKYEGGTQDQTETVVLAH